ncbi:ABC transporter substrate-binding protein [Paracoccus liaowanqingii]|uniref:ABC transporter substrate-binding protein n=1 Tax=Paracoccus liaowanqingii TaxID=2560053 RepID=A0A4V1BJ31_9RHOB|nr:extracellular solute-binding protein [Paracoccus liaowanqingii]QBX34872.1 ABC transporter substrate-binding protein [Paracoccus liaowanqingii]
MRPTAPAAALLAALTAALPAAAQEVQTAEGVITSHGISTFEDVPMPADYPNLAYVNPDAPKGGELSQHGIGTFDSYNPFTFRGRATAPSTMMLERLMEPVLDDPHARYCLLCETIEYPESRDWVIFNLRPEARFSDGTPLTAHDVLFTYQTLIEKGFPSYAEAIKRMVASAEVLDDHRIRFDFTPEAPRRDSIGQMGAQIVFSQADFEANDRDLTQTSNVPFLGSGPYMFDRADFGRSITMRRNPDYWGRDLPIKQGRHNFDLLRFEYFSDFDAAFEAFKAGIYTFRVEPSEQIWSTGYDFPAFTAGAVVKEEIPDGVVATGDAWVFNLRQPKFQDIRVREAIGLMFNFEWSNDALFYGMNTRLDSFWDNSDLKAEGPPSPEELALLTPVAGDLPETVLTDDAVTSPASGERQLDRANSRRAAQLLDEAGWTTGSDGMRRNEAGQTLQVQFLDHNQSFDRIVNPFVENLRAIGVDAVLTRVDPSELTTRTRSHDFDIVRESLGNGYSVGGGTSQAFGSEFKDDVFNPMGLANPAIDALIENASAAVTDAENRVGIAALDRALRSLRFWIPQWYRPYHTVAYWDVYDRPETLPPYGLGVTDMWWYDSARADELRAAGQLR